MIVVAWSSGSEALNTIVIVTLVSFANESDIRGTGNARDFYFLFSIRSTDFTR